MPTMSPDGLVSLSLNSFEIGVLADTVVTADSAIMHPKEKIIALKCRFSFVSPTVEEAADKV